MMCGVYSVVYARNYIDEKLALPSALLAILASTGPVTSLGRLALLLDLLQR